MAAEVGLKASLREWKKNWGDAQKIAANALSGNVFRDFNRRGEMAFMRLQKNLGKLRSAIFSLPTLAGALGLYAAERQLQELAGRSIRIGREFADARQRLVQAIEASDKDVSLPKLDAWAEEARIAFGKTRGELDELLSRFVASGYGGEDALKLGQLAIDLDAWSTSVKGLEQASKIVQDLTQGKLEGAASAGLVLGKPSGDAQADAERALKRLREVTAGAAGSITNPSEKLAATWEELFFKLSNETIPRFDASVTKLNNFLTAYGESALHDDLDRLFENVDGIWGGLKQIQNVGSALIDAGKETVPIRFQGNLLDLLIKTPRSGFYQSLGRLQQVASGFSANPGGLPKAAEMNLKKSDDALRENALWSAWIGLKDALFSAESSRGARELRARFDALEREGAALNAAAPGTDRMSVDEFSGLASPTLPAAAQKPKATVRTSAPQVTVISYDPSRRYARRGAVSY